MKLRLHPLREMRLGVLDAVQQRCDVDEERRFTATVTKVVGERFGDLILVSASIAANLSRQIQDLEREVGARLLNRSSRRIELTPADAVFLDEASLVLAQAERAVQRTREVARANASRLTLGFTAGVEIDLAGVATALGDDLKTVELTLRSQPSPELVRSLHARLIDAAFIRSDEDSKGLVVRTVRREPLLAAVPASRHHKI
jgi:LysR family transcriptional regulator, hca operon transcriptional activator